MIAKMVKIEVTGLKEYLPQTIEILQEVGSLHPEEVPLEGTELQRYAPSEEQNEERRTLERCENSLLEVCALLPPSAHYGSQKYERETVEKVGEDYRFVAEEAEALVSELRSLLRQRDELQNELRVLSRYQKILEAVVPMVREGKLGANTDLIGITIESSQKEVIESFRKALSRATEGHSELRTRQVTEDRSVGVVAYDVQYQEKVRELLNRESVRELSLPEEVADKPLEDSVEILSRRVESLPSQIDETRKKISSFLGANGSKALGMERAVADRLAQLRVISKFAQTANTFVIQGWMPERDVKRADELLRLRLGESVFLHTLHREEAEREEIPIKLENPKPFKPFELLVSIFPSPAYATVDPTILLAIGFPIFYGLMLGDVGYGLVVMGLAILLWRKWGSNPVIKQTSIIIAHCAGWTILFGAIFGEFFGFTAGHDPWVPGVFEGRGSIASALLGVTVLIGLLHVFIGIVLGIYNGVVEKNWHHTVEKVGLLLALICFTLLAVFVMKINTEKWVLWGSILSFGVALVALSVGAGLGGAVELFTATVLSHTLSYARIMAFGLASLIIAEIANDLGRGIKPVFVGVLVAIIVHLGNILLGVYAPTLQGLRLNYVEFMPKFYAFGGRDYEPLKKKGVAE